MKKMVQKKMAHRRELIEKSRAAYQPQKVDDINSRMIWPALVITAVFGLLVLFAWVVK